MKRAAVAVGTFDGLHIGHRHLLLRLVQMARAEHLRSVVVTLFNPVRPVPGLLTTLDEKIRLLSTLPIDDIVVLPTTPDIIDLPAKVFFDTFIVKKLGARRLVVGQNFAFGFGREGTTQWLKKAGPAQGVKVTIMHPVCREGAVISSSRIRALLLEGDVEAAVRLLGRFYHIEGKPERGRGVGTLLGFPTINLGVPREKLLPQGVFAALAQGGGVLMPAVVNIGTRPTFFSEGRMAVEINLLDFNGQWENETTSIFLCRRLREEQRFRTTAALRRQIARDREAAAEYFSGVHLK